MNEREMSCFEDSRYSDFESDYCSDDGPCAGRDCDMGYCVDCGGNTSGGGCLREGCEEDCCMEYEECACDCRRCGGCADASLWCQCGSEKVRCKAGTMLKLGYFQGLWRGYRYRKDVIR